MCEKPPTPATLHDNEFRSKVPNTCWRRVAEWDLGAFAAHPIDRKTFCGGRSSSKVGMLGCKVSFRSCTLRNSANTATCSLEVVAKMPQHTAKCQRGQGVWQAVKFLLKLVHRLEVKLWRQQKLAPHFCTMLGWQKFGDTLSLSSALFFSGTEKRGTANNHHLGCHPQHQKESSNQNWKNEPKTVPSSEKVTDCYRWTAGAGCCIMHESGQKPLKQLEYKPGI